MPEKDNRQRAERVKMIIMDVDGTLTDGTLLLLPDGEEVKSYNVLDGLGILLANLAGIKTGIITGKFSKPLAKRAKNLKVLELYQGILDKKKSCMKYSKNTTSIVKMWPISGTILETSTSSRKSDSPAPYPMLMQSLKSTVIITVV